MMCANYDGRSISAFWRHLKTLGDYKHHTVLHNLSDEELTRAIPFAIHGDGAEFHNNNEYFVMSWTSAFQPGGGSDCLVSRYPISIVSEAQMVDDEDLWGQVKAGAKVPITIGISPRNQLGNNISYFLPLLSVIFMF